MKKFLAAFLLSTLTCYAGVENLRRTIVLDNGLTFDIKPDYHNERLCVELTVSHGFARLNDDENYDIHSKDDSVSIKFYNHDFDNNFSAYKCTYVEKSRLDSITKLGMRYPAWVEDK